MDSETQTLLEEILSSLKSIEARVSALESQARGGATESTSNSEEKRLSLKEFLIDRKPSNGVQTTLAIAYFLENYDGVSPFNASDIERGFRAAREPVPININDKANMCVKNGYLMEDGAKKNNMKAWVVTRTGDEMVRSGFRKLGS